MEKVIDITGEDIEDHSNSLVVEARSLMQQRADVDIRMRSLEAVKKDLNNQMMEFLIQNDCKSVKDTHFGTITYIQQTRERVDVNIFKEELMKRGVDPIVISASCTVATTETPSMFIKYSKPKEK